MTGHLLRQILTEGWLRPCLCAPPHHLGHKFRMLQFMAKATPPTSVCYSLCGAPDCNHLVTFLETVQLNFIMKWLHSITRSTMWLANMTPPQKKTKHSAFNHLIHLLNKLQMRLSSLLNVYLQDLIGPLPWGEESETAPGHGQKATLRWLWNYQYIKMQLSGEDTVIHMV